jgi:glycosyltransferase involved in cell wall biosynthesis
MKDLSAAYARWNRFPLVSISDFQRHPMPWANWVGTVHHGFPAELYEFRPAGEGYLAFLGRISPEKRPDLAIEIARRCGKPLRMAAKVDYADRGYWTDHIEPMVRAEPLVQFMGEIGDAEKSDFLGGADALLFPIDWPEPFGLVMIEAMACGAPVIAFGCGSVQEVVEHGRSGFIVEGVDEAVSAVGRLAELSRARVRRRFEARFSARTMAQRYVELYIALGRRDRDPLGVHPGLRAASA